jgi:hypothetical protein
MTIAFDASSNSGYEASLSTYSWNHTVGSSVLFGGVLCGVAIFLTGTVLSITYGGVALSFVRADVSGIYRSEIWYLPNPPLGSNSVVVTLSTSLTSIAGVSSYSKCGGVAAQGGASGINTPASLSITPLQNNAIVVANLTTKTASGISDAGGQTNCWNNSGALGSNFSSNSGPVTPAAATTITYNGIGVVDTWVMSAVALLDITTMPRPIYRV